MIYSIITIAGLVVYSMNWPVGSMNVCEKTITEFVIENTDQFKHHGIQAWCATYPARPPLESKLSPKR